MFRNVMHSIGKKRADGHLRNSANIHDVAVNPLRNPKDVPEADMYESWVHMGNVLPYN
jgi:hypothetical protein